jgi:hypothetical protein
MGTLAAFNLTLALIDGLGVLWPQIQEMARRGEISPEQEEQLKAKLALLRLGKDGPAFSGPEWKPAP